MVPQYRCRHSKDTGKLIGVASKAGISGFQWLFLPVCSEFGQLAADFCNAKLFEKRNNWLETGMGKFPRLVNFTL